MPRTRRSSRLNRNDKKAPTETDVNVSSKIASPGASPLKTYAKKRTVSDRSPAMKTRKKAAKEIKEGENSPHYEGDRIEGLEDEENKENVKDAPLTPSVTPYWKVRYHLSVFVSLYGLMHTLTSFSLYTGGGRK